MDMQLETIGTFTVAKPSGEIRSEDAGSFSDRLQPLVAEADSKLALDFSGVTFIDSRGLTALINVVTRARLAGAHVVLVSPTSFVAGVFEVTNLDKWFDIAEDLSSARSMLGVEA